MTLLQDALALHVAWRHSWRWSQLDLTCCCLVRERPADDLPGRPAIAVLIKLSVTKLRCAVAHYCISFKSESELQCQRCNYKSKLKFSMLRACSSGRDNGGGVSERSWVMHRIRVPDSRCEHQATSWRQLC